MSFQKSTKKDGITLRSLIVVYARLAIISKKFVNLHVCWDLHIYEI